MPILDLVSGNFFVQKFVSCVLVSLLVISQLYKKACFEKSAKNRVFPRSSLGEHVEKVCSLKHQNITKMFLRGFWVLCVQKDTE